MEKDIYKELENRIGAEHLGKRLRLQVDHSARFLGEGRGGFHWENIKSMPTILKLLLRLTGLRKRSEQNTLDYRVENIEVSSKTLPASFDGLRILHLSDVHLDGVVDRGQKLYQIIGELDFDLCVITGDFRFLTLGVHKDAIEQMKVLVDFLQCEHGIYGILGNHDFIEMVPELEAVGVTMLLNESLPIKVGEDCIWIAGVDDPHFYGVDDLEKAMVQVATKNFSLLLAHSPEIIEEAAKLGIDYYLCGHTHAGQICLPGGIPLLTNANCSREYISGSWRHKDMYGYTSRGTGESCVSVRFFCPPEITIHRLFCE